MNRYRKFLFLILFFAASISLFAQVKIHRNIRVEDGLVQSTILSIFPDSRGYVWIGTVGGLSRWDGIQFKNFSTFNGLSHERVSTITETLDGNLLFGTLNGLTFIKGNKFISYGTADGLLANDISALCTAQNGDIYIGSSRGVNIFREGKMDTLGSSANVLGIAIKNIYQGKDGTIYIGTFLRGVYILKDNSFKHIDVNDGLIHNKVNDIIEGRDGTIYFGTNYGLSIYSNGAITSLSQKNGLPESYVSSLVEGTEGEIYIGLFGGGLCIYKNGGLEVIEKDNGLSNSFINELAKDHNGMIYIGTNGSGLFMYGGGQFVTYNESVGLANNIIMSINEDKDGNLYFGSLNGGLSILKNGKILNYNSNNGLLYNSITGIFPSKSGNMYICTRRGMQIFDPKKRTFSVLNPFRRNEISTVYEDDNGTTYFGAGRGVYIYKNGKAKWDLGENSNLYSYITKILKSSDGSFYYGTTSNGLIVKNGAEYKVYNEENGLVNYVLDILERKDGSFLIATYKGLFIKNGDVLDTLTTRDGLSDNIVYSILEGDNDEIYITTNRGLNIIDFSHNPVKVRILTHADGLASDECNQTALFKDSKGKIWIGTVRGVSCYDPAKDLPHDVAPKVHFTRVRLFEEEIPLSDFNNHLAFRYNENYFKFDFIGINISSPQSVRYRYRMAGLDKDWFETNQRYVQYTNLNNGDYRFEVMASNEWGYWSKPVVIPFSVLSPFWETWWFITIILLFVIGTVTFFVMYRVRQLIAIERLRTKIAADLHDNIGSSLTEISILGEVLAHKLDKSNQEIKKGLTTIAETSRTLIDNMSDIVWLVNPKRDSLYDLIIRLKDSYTDLLYHKGISFKSSNLKSLEKISLSMECRQNLYLIFKEAIHNSLKHSNCSEITLDADIRGKSLNMILRDNGEGFDKELKGKGNGMSNMLDRAGMIGGILLIESNIGSGTMVQFQGSIL